MNIRNFLNGMAIQHKHKAIRIYTQDEKSVAKITWIGDSYIIHIMNNDLHYAKEDILCQKILSIQNNTKYTEIVTNL